MRTFLPVGRATCCTAYLDLLGSVCAIATLLPFDFNYSQRALLSDIFPPSVFVGLLVFFHSLEESDLEKPQIIMNTRFPGSFVPVRQCPFPALFLSPSQETS